MTSIPLVITDAIQRLLDALPVYTVYEKCLGVNIKDTGPLRSLLVDIYVEYLTFCIHTKNATISPISKLRPSTMHLKTASRLLIYAQRI